MRKLIIAFFIMLIACPAFATGVPQTEEQKTLYALGVLISRQLEAFSLSAEEFEFVQQGLVDGAGGKKIIAEPEAYKQTINQLASVRTQKTAEKQKEKSTTYLEAAVKEKDAQKSVSGLIYVPINAGTGKQPKITDIVKVHYKGTFIDGKEFDSSVKRGQSVEFPLNQVIPCWTEGLSMMKVGGKAKLVCPSNIAYGDQGRPPVIPGGATLVFEVELLDVKDASAAAPKIPLAPKAGKKK